MIVCSLVEGRGALHRVYRVAVGTDLTARPPHRSGQADFPHPALASGSDAQTARGIGIADAGRRQIRGDEPLHSLPLHATMLASPAQCAMPEVAHGEAKVGQGVPVARNSEVSEMPALLRIGFTPTHHPRMDAAQ